MGKAGFVMTIVAVAGLAEGPGAFGYQELAVRDGGTIAGKVSFKGTVPAPQHYLVHKNPDVCGRERDFVFVRVKGGALQNVVVVLEGVAQGKPFAAPPAEFVSKDCAFLPYVTIAAKKGGEGWPVFKVENTDTVMHNPHAYEIVGPARRTLFNVGLPEKGSKIEKELKFRKGNAIKLECDQHDFMQSWARVVESPYYAVVADDGTYTIDQVPPGTYKLVAWHPVLGEQAQEVTVTAKGHTAAHVTFSKDSKD